MILSFPTVDFAEVYKININGQEITKDAPKTDITKIDITQYIGDPDSYYIKVAASNPGNASFNDSDWVMVSYLKTVKLEAPALTVEKSELP